MREDQDVENQTRQTIIPYDAAALNILTVFRKGSKYIPKSALIPSATRLLNFKRKALRR